MEVLLCMFGRIPLSGLELLFASFFFFSNYKFNFTSSDWSVQIVCLFLTPSCQAVCL